MTYIQPRSTFQAPQLVTKGLSIISPRIDSPVQRLDRSNLIVSIFPRFKLGAANNLFRKILQRGVTEGSGNILHYVRTRERVRVYVRTNVRAFVKKRPGLIICPGYWSPCPHARATPGA